MAKISVKRRVKSLGLTSEEAKEHRMNWTKGLKGSMEESKSMIKVWKRIDTTKWPFRPLGRLIVDFGGWQDPAAIRGALTGATQCLTMGPPFIKIHPQTKMLLFAIAEMEFVETFEQAWKTTVEYYTEESDPSNKPRTPSLPTAAASLGSQATGPRATPTAKAKAKATETKSSTSGEPNATIEQPMAKADQKELQESTDSQTANASETISTKKDMTPEQIAARENKKTLDAKIRAGLAMKTLISTSTSRANEILAQIQTDGSKFEAMRKHKQGDQYLTQILFEARSGLTPWQIEFLTTADWQNQRKKIDDRKIDVEMDKIVKLKAFIKKIRGGKPDRHPTPTLSKSYRIL